MARKPTKPWLCGFSNNSSNYIPWIKTRVFGPKYPTAGVMPFAAWNLASAARVKPPKVDVSFPGEPGPLSAIAKPFAFKNAWSARTSSPVAPTSRSRVNAVLDGAADADGVAGMAALPPAAAFIAARVFGPKYPTDGVMPFASWNFASAARVKPPKVVVSFPGEPGPLSAMVKPFAFRNFWSARTSSPVPPTSTSRVNTVFDGATGADGVAGVVALPRAPAFIAALVFGPKYPADGVMPFAAWNFASAARVKPPKVVVSFPGEPGPLSAMVKPFTFRNFWSARTSSPVPPTS